MLNDTEKRFVEYWEKNRDAKKRWLRNISVGMPLSVVLVITIFINFFSGWYKRATVVMDKEATSLVLVLILAALLIVIFVVIFSARHRWDQNEQHYRELLARSGE